MGRDEAREVLVEYARRGGTILRPDGDDAQPHVVEHPRVARVPAPQLGARCLDLAGERVPVRAELRRQAGEEGTEPGRVAVFALDRRGPTEKVGQADLHPAAGEAGDVLGHVREVPAEPGARVLCRGARGPRRPRGGLRRCIPFLRTRRRSDRRAGARGRRRLHVVGLRHPVERRVGEDGVERARVVERLPVPHDELDGGHPPARRLDHRRRCVEADDGGPGGGDGGRELSGAAAEIEHALAGAGPEEVDEIRGHAVHERGARRIEIGVPRLRRRVRAAHEGQRGRRARAPPEPHRE